MAYSLPLKYNISMYKLYPYFTNDGSVGLYSHEDNDVYHSTYGALTEAYEKFVQPADIHFYLENSDKIKILDICYGIGYNSKTLLNYFFEKNFETKTHTIVPIYTDKISDINYDESIYTDNNSILNSNNYIDKLYTDNDVCKNSAYLPSQNKNFKIYIKAIDTDKILAFLSPFIVCNKKKLPKNYKLPFKNEKIAKMMKKFSEPKIKFSDLINVIFFEKIVENLPEIFENSDVNSILGDKKYKKFFDPFICRLFKSKKLTYELVYPFKHIHSFLHNIYYRYLSKRYKKALKCPIFNDFIFDIKIRDARQEILDDKNKYNLIFLDAFTPSKCPALWSIDFFKLLFEHLEDNGKILTYSNSAAVRNAFMNAGFHVGKIFDAKSQKFIGTMAVKNKSFIKYELSDYDLGLLKTRAGIFYRDENLTLDNEDILKAHNKEVEISNLISSSKFIKSYKNKNKV